MIEIKLTDHVTFIGYDNEIDMKKQIIKMICEMKSNSILHKGLPENVDRKMINRLIPLQNYFDIIENLNYEFCLIYKVGKKRLLKVNI